MWIINRKTNTAVNSFTIASVFISGKDVKVSLTNGREETIASYETEEEAEMGLSAFISSPGGFIRRTVSLPTAEDLKSVSDEVPDIVTDSVEYPWDIDENNDESDAESDD